MPATSNQMLFSFGDVECNPPSARRQQQRRRQQQGRCDARQGSRMGEQTKLQDRFRHCGKNSLPRRIMGDSDEACVNGFFRPHEHPRVTPHPFRCPRPGPYGRRGRQGRHGAPRAGARPRARRRGRVGSRQHLPPPEHAVGRRRRARRPHDHAGDDRGSGRPADPSAADRDGSLVPLRLPAADPAVRPGRVRSERAHLPGLCGRWRLRPGGGHAGHPARPAASGRRT